PWKDRQNGVNSAFAGSPGSDIAILSAGSSATSRLFALSGCCLGDDHPSSRRSSLQFRTTGDVQFIRLSSKRLERADVRAPALIRLPAWFRLRGSSFSSAARRRGWPLHRADPAWRSLR